MRKVNGNNDRHAHTHTHIPKHMPNTVNNHAVRSDDERLWQLNSTKLGYDENYWKRLLKIIFLYFCNYLFFCAWNKRRNDINHFFGVLTYKYNNTRVIIPLWRLQQDVLLAAHTFPISIFFFCTPPLNERINDAFWNKRTWNRKLFIP